jgi:hypothetical protein
MKKILLFLLLTQTTICFAQDIAKKMAGPKKISAICLGNVMSNPVRARFKDSLGNDYWTDRTWKVRFVITTPKRYKNTPWEIITTTPNSAYDYLPGKEYKFDLRKK